MEVEVAFDGGAGLCGLVHALAHGSHEFLGVGTFPVDCDITPRVATTADPVGETGWASGAHVRARHAAHRSQSPGVSVGICETAANANANAGTAGTHEHCGESLGLVGERDVEWRYSLDGGAHV
ncbi:hypothetical protein [Embleya sp. NPDC059237]|uniref:hypothetical protein n=1 Tax=Embleya sp. NPDC059237 TaxID=3346784 RepID=UPI0036CC9987